MMNMNSTTTPKYKILSYINILYMTGQSSTSVQKNFIQEFQYKKDKYSSDYQTSVYQNIEISKWMNISYYLFYVFYAVLIILCYFLYIQPNMSYKIKILILILFILYPFYIYSGEKMIYYIIKYIYCLATGQVFTY